MRWIRVLRGLGFTSSVIVLATLSFLAIAGAQTSPNSPPSRFTVVLDAAHGGDDTGGRLASGQMEKADTLALSVRMRSLLAARGMAVVTTRESDTAVDPVQRAQTANHAKAAACLSLHATESGSGIHIFTSSLAPAEPARFVPWKTAQAAWITRSLALAGALNSALLHEGFNVTLSRTDLIGVDNMTCPALAIEIAPLRGPDGKVVAEPDDADYQAHVANTLATALLAWRMEPHQP
ncbi:MAG TPA: N-acetylmuramoyl-L-alanine amidase [Terracidiphilus sp.]|jgi:N-acetylmuramoyl-L-alanine amidase|nr:N-acetylmuramoyl-L-alanine amidase [Terracidiphilus sp.]